MVTGPSLQRDTYIHTTIMHVLSSITIAVVRLAIHTHLHHSAEDAL